MSRNLGSASVLCTRVVLFVVLLFGTLPALTSASGTSQENLVPSDQDNLTRTTDHRDNVTGTTYNLLGWKAAMADPDMETWGYTYGNITKSAGNSYAFNNPLRFVDPGGNSEEDCGQTPHCRDGSSDIQRLPQPLPNTRYLCTQYYGCFDNTHWGAGNPAQLLYQLAYTIEQGGGIVGIQFPTMFGTYAAYYEITGTIPSDRVTNVGLGIYSDASTKFEKWEQLGIFGLETTFAVEDLPTHYLSFVEAATGISKEEIFSHLGPVTGTDEDPPHTLWPFGDNTSKNRQMTPRVQRDGKWVNVPWPTALSITPFDTSSGMWKFTGDTTVGLLWALDQNPNE